MNKKTVQGLRPWLYRNLGKPDKEKVAFGKMQLEEDEKMSEFWAFDHSSQLDNASTRTPENQQPLSRAVFQMKTRRNL